MSLKARLTRLEQLKKYQKLAEPVAFFFLPIEHEEPQEWARVTAEIEAYRVTSGKEPVIIVTIDEI